MKFRLILGVIFLINVFCFQSLAQETDFILSEEENQTWLEKLGSSGLEVQLEELKKRFMQDTAVYFNYLSGNYESPKQKTALAKRDFLKESKSRPLYVFAYKEESLKLPGNPPEAKKILKLVEEIDAAKISGIEIFQGVTARALYGSSGTYGVVNIALKEKTTLNRIREIL